MSRTLNTFPVAVVGASAVSAAGFRWRGMGMALAGLGGAPSRQLAVMGSEVPSFEVPAIPPSEDAGEPRSHKLMSRAARLAAVATRGALLDAGWEGGRERVGLFLGIGAADGPLPELRDILKASLVGGRLDLPLLAREGLAAANPLFAFHLLNNFNLCHASIAEGVRGPNAAFFSRGSGTAFALVEAAHALAEGDCEHALAGGADSAHYPGTWLDLARAGFVDRGLVPGEGAAVFALSRETQKPLAIVEACALVPGRGRPLDETTRAALADLPASPVDAVVLAAWGPPARVALAAAVDARAPGARTIDLSSHLGDALAALPALGWAVALDLVQRGGAHRALVLGAGVDGDATATLLAQPGATP